MQSLLILTLRLTLAYRGSGHVWKTAVRELTDEVYDMHCVLARNLKEMERRVSPTASHATVLLFPTQKLIRQLLDTPDACEPTGKFTNAFLWITT